MSLYWQCNSSAICSLLALDEALRETSLIRWQNRPQELIRLDELRAAAKNKKGKTTQQQIQDVESLTSLLLELSTSSKLPEKLSVNLDGYNISLNRQGNRYISGNISANANTVDHLQQVANKAMNELSAKYREALQDAKEEISRQEQLLEDLADSLSAEELEAKRAQLNAHREALTKANNEELKKQEEQLREVAKEMNLEVLNPVRLSRKKKFVFIRRS